MSSAAKHDVFQAIADPTRRKLLRILADQEMPVNVISRHFPISRTAVSKHLRILSDAGLVRERKVGRETRYKLQPERLIELRQWLSFFERFWDEKIAMLKNFVENEELNDANIVVPEHDDRKSTQ